jgi:atypical dual specificity phosphatase
VSPRLARALFVPSLFLEGVAWAFTDRRWWDRVDEALLVGALPFFWHVPRLKEAGVCQVINLCDEWAGPVTAYRRLGVEQLRLPTPDYSPPPLSHVLTAIDAIERGLRAGQGTYLHCKAGRGRSAIVALCWIMKTRRLCALEADRWLRRCRPQVDDHLSRREVVGEFAGVMSR